MEQDVLLRVVLSLTPASLVCSLDQFVQLMQQSEMRSHLDQAEVNTLQTLVEKELSSCSVTVQSNMKARR